MLEIEVDEHDDADPVPDPDGQTGFAGRVAERPAGAMEVTDWNRTSRSPMAPLARPVPVVAMTPYFALLPKVSWPIGNYKS